MQSWCHSAFWLRATWLSTTEPSFQALCWVNKLLSFSSCPDVPGYSSFPHCSSCAGGCSPVFVPPFPISFWSWCSRETIQAWDSQFGSGLKAKTLLWLLFFLWGIEAVLLSLCRAPWRSVVMLTFQKQTSREEIWVDFFSLLNLS